MLQQRRPLVIPVLLSAAIVLALVFGLAAVLFGCAGNPLSAAHTPEQRAYALYGEFVIFEEQAVALRSSGELTPPLLVAIQKADMIAKPTADALLQATQDVIAAQRQLDSGSGSPEKLKIATDNLTRWVTQGQTDITNLASAVKGKAP